MLLIIKHIQPASTAECFLLKRHTNLILEQKENIRWQLPCNSGVISVSHIASDSHGTLTFSAACSCRPCSFLCVSRRRKLGLGLLDHDGCSQGGCLMIKVNYIVSRGELKLLKPQKWFSVLGNALSCLPVRRQFRDGNRKQLASLIMKNSGSPGTCTHDSPFYKLE